MFNNTFSARLNSSGTFWRGGIRYWLSPDLKDNIPVLSIGRPAAASLFPSCFDDEYEGTLSRAGAQRSPTALPPRPQGLQGLPGRFPCPPPAAATTKVVMLFFTQCFGAVLDLIHLRFQHYKAKRVFSAAGQLVCVVNPTHSLKVSQRWFFPLFRFLLSLIPNPLPPAFLYPGIEMMLRQQRESAVNTSQPWRRGCLHCPCCRSHFRGKGEHPAAQSGRGKSLLPKSPKFPCSFHPCDKQACCEPWGKKERKKNKKVSLMN